MDPEFRLLMIGAMYENGGNTTHRFLDGQRQLAGELAVESLAGGQKQEAEPVFRQLFANALADQARGVKADFERCLVHALRCLRTHMRATVQHPVDGRDADARGFGELLDRRSPGHVSSSGGAHRSG